MIDHLKANKLIDTSTEDTTSNIAKQIEDYKTKTLKHISELDVLEYAMKPPTPKQIFEKLELDDVEFSTFKVDLRNAIIEKFHKKF